MMNTRPLLVVAVSLLVLAASVLRGEAAAATPGEVLTLDVDNFAGAIKKHPFIAVEFYAPVRCVSYSFAHSRLLPFVFPFPLLYRHGTSFLFFNSSSFFFPCSFTRSSLHRPS